MLLALEVRKFKLGSPSTPYASSDAGKMGKWADAKADRLWNGEGHGYVKLIHGEVGKYKNPFLL